MKPVLTALMEYRAQEKPAEVFLKFRDQRIAWGELFDNVSRVARGLHDAGVQPGARVAIMLPNRPEFLYAHFGAISAGCIPVPINTAHRGDTLAFLLADSRPAAIVAAGEYADRFEPGEMKEFVLGDPVRASASRFEDLLSARPELPELQDAPAEGFGVMYTSGTTGPPKGVVQVRNDLAPVLALWQAMEVQPGETIYTPLPLFHGNPLGLSVVGAMFLDAKIAIGERFSASKFWDEVRAFEAVEFNHVGAVIPILLKQPPSPRDRNNPVRVVLSAGCPRDAWVPFQERFGVRIVEQFSMVDSPGYLINTDGTVGSMGKPAPGCEAAILGEDGEELPAGRVGELVLRAGEGRTHSYLNRPDVTDEAYRDGWFHTGDLAHKDANGSFYYAGRKRESMRRRGENVSAWEVENVVNQFPGVLESAAHAVPSPLGEDDIKVVVVPLPGASVDPRALTDFCESRMARYAIPRYVEVRAEIPKTPTERPRYAELKAEGITGREYDREA